MRVEMTPQNFQAGSVLRIRQSYKKNQNRPFLYKDVICFLREHKLPANINMGGKKDRIDITYITDSAKAKLKEMGIGFSYVKK